MRRLHPGLLAVTLPIALTVLSCLGASSAAAPQAASPSATAIPATPVVTPPAVAPPSAGFDQARALETLRASIAGREKEPAEKVFQNIQILQGVPAGRLLAIMELGYAASLGVDCRHCHVPGRFESEEKKEKQIAREMSRMARDINQKYLAAIQGLDSEKPAINCTTCHRGEVKPALNLRKS
jgi:hypothetical protein